MAIAVAGYTGHQRETGKRTLCAGRGRAHLFWGFMWRYLKILKTRKDALRSPEQVKLVLLHVGILMGRQDGDSSYLLGLLRGLMKRSPQGTTTKAVTIAIQAQKSSILKTQPKGKEKVCVSFLIMSVTLTHQAEFITTTHTPTVIHFHVYNVSCI